MPRTSKTTRALITSTVIAGSLTFTALATATSHQDRFPISIADIEAKTAERFAKVDADASGDVDLAEFEAASMPQGRPERGQNRQNRSHGPRGPKQHGQGKRQQGGPAGHGRQGLGDPATREAMRENVSTELFALVDSDQDGVISKSEFTAGQVPGIRRIANKRAMFKHLDTNNDQRLTAQEFPNPAERLRRAHADADGSVSLEEMRAHRQKSRQGRAAG